MARKKNYSKRKEKSNRKKAREADYRKQVVSFLQLFDIEQYRMKAEMMERRFVLHVGPTNSGKTYTAIQALKKCRSGVYLGPLRLLALEMYDTLNEAGCLTELITGEEYIKTEGAWITASTIELLNYSKEYDVAVIDEAQMIADDERGDKWTKAIYLVNAKEVHICLAPHAEELIKEILDGFGAFYTVEHHERLAPLEYAGTMKSIQNVQAGDAIIMFSRKAVLATAAELQNFGIKSSVIYGALPPASRREEVRKFSSGENTVVVATDAIGMGISLPIRRIIFREVSKFDGVERRSLRTQEIKQIAGRAGRFGIYNKGEVLTMSNARLIRNALEEPDVPLVRITIPFPEEAVETKYNLMKMLEEWQLLKAVPGYKRADMAEPIFLLKKLEKTGRHFDKKLLYRLITCPVDTKNDSLVGYWKESCCLINDGELPEVPCFPEDTLEGCELQYKALDVRHQLMRQLGIEDDRMEEKMELCRKINQFLLEDKGDYLRRCRKCGKILPATYSYGFCQKCFDEKINEWAYNRSTSHRRKRGEEK